MHTPTYLIKTVILHQLFSWHLSTFSLQILILNSHYHNNPQIFLLSPIWFLATYTITYLNKHNWKAFSLCVSQISCNGSMLFWFGFMQSVTGVWLDSGVLKIRIWKHYARMPFVNLGRRYTILRTNYRRICARRQPVQLQIPLHVLQLATDIAGSRHPLAFS